MNVDGNMPTLEEHRKAMQAELDVFYAKDGNGAGLPRPSLSDELVGRLQHVQGQKNLWSTDPDVVAPYAGMNSYVRKFLGNLREDFVLIGLSSSNAASLTSNAYCVCYVTSNVACFFQIRWGNINDDPQAQKSLMNAYLFQTQLIESFIKEAKELNLELPGERLLWVYDECAPDVAVPKFCWVQPGDHDLDALKDRWTMGRSVYSQMVDTIPGSKTIPEHLKPGRPGGKSVEHVDKK